MIVLLLIYFVGKAFYDLAKRHEKNGWLFAILGVAAYYLGTIVGAVIVMLVYEVLLLKSFDDADSLLLNIISIPIGILVCWLFYLILDHVWSKQPAPPPSSEDILDADLFKNEQQDFDTDKKL